MLPSFPGLEILTKQVLKAIRGGQKFLSRHRDDSDKITYTWIEKVSYGPGILSRTYCLAATHAASRYPINSAQWKALPNILGISFEKIAKFVKFYARIPLVASESSWKLTASLIEGYLFIPRLSRIRLDFFPR